MGPQFKVSSERLEKPGIEHTTTTLQGESLYHYTTEASTIDTTRGIKHDFPFINIHSFLHFPRDLINE